MPIEYHDLACDVLVAGGGAAGLPCALSAARCGAQVILCQDRPVLGGNASSEVRMHIVGANGTGRFDRGEPLTTEAREGGIIEEIRLENCVHNPQRSASVFDLILYDLCRREPNLTLLLNTSVTAATRTGPKIDAVVAERQSTEDVFRIHAAIYVDCTGDGRLAAEAGAVWMEGREGMQTHGESLAPEVADSYRLGSTILLQARRHDRPLPFVAPPWARKFSRHDLRLRLYATPGEEEPTHEYGYWWAEWGGQLDTIRDNETIRDELLSVALGIWDHVKNGPPEDRRRDEGSNPDSASHWALDWIGFLPGKRESRRLIGQHILTEHDLLRSKPFDDAIAYGGWSLDLHPPEGIDAIDRPPCEQHMVPYLYDIPLRSCIARDIDNLMFAGRNLSATHVAFSSTRVMATCAVVGQGVGTAAAYAAYHSLDSRKLATDSAAVAQIQRRLIYDDAFLIGQAGETLPNLAESATITASSEQADGAASHVASMATRAVHGARGVEPGRCVASSHRWMSDRAAGLPAWLELAWDTVVTMRELQIIFDTGMDRHLTLSHHDGYTRRMIWGTSQPETVRSFSVAIERPCGSHSRIAEVDGNYQRRYRLALPQPVELRKMRIDVTDTGGLDHARVFQILVLPAAASPDVWLL